MMLLGAMGLLAGCSTVPKVVADVTEVLPARSADSIMIYEPNDVPPIEAKEIGKIKVTDGGMTPAYNCLYGNMLALAVKKTAACGGNALHVDEHRLPGMASNCHRIWGTMYVMPDSLVDSNTVTTLQSIEEKTDAELGKLTREQIQRREKALNNPANVFKLSVGPAWITSEIVTERQRYKSKLGIGVTADYQHLWRSGLGVGVSYLYYGTSFEGDYSMRIHYIGPAFVCSTKLGDKWRWDVALSLGYTLYKEIVNGSHQGMLFRDASATESRLGFTGQMGIEYMVSREVGIGFQINTFTVSMKKPEGYNISSDEFYGIRRMDTLLGLRYYF